MRGKSSVKWLCAVVGTVCLAEGAQADTIEVGSGVNQAELWIEFGDGALYDFTISFGLVDADTSTGLALFDIVEAETSLTTVRQDWGEAGILIDGIAFDGHSDSGWTGGENYWHYWTMESDDTVWSSSMLAVGKRVVEDGDADGWVYGRAGAPAPEPASLGLVVIGAVIALRRWR
ncbi:MAG: hypothetical protein GY842_02040 [bacterium]|nr:hypothetical protein [bacterium]